MPTEGEWFYEVHDVDGKDVGMAAIYERVRDERAEDGIGAARIVVLDTATAHRIVTAVNCHEELVGLAREYREYIEFEGYTSTGEGIPRRLSNWDKKRMDKLDAVLAKAREET